ncbi:MAG TPA: hypothetical protein VFY83_00635 [Anaerolineales bacterium]|nr:hypothetical protein [Anaerolineales bacterium]
MNTAPVLFAVDRSLSVPAGKIIKTCYVPIHKVQLACRERMSIGDVDRAYQKRLQLGRNQPWPPPVGRWGDDGYFVLTDGRHEYVATLMLGHESILVAWIE